MKPKMTKPFPTWEVPWERSGMGIMGRGFLVRVRVLLPGITLRVSVPGLFMGTSFLGFGLGLGLAPIFT